MVINVHNRVLKASLSEVGWLLDHLATEEDRLWPRQCYWPAMEFDRKLQKGAIGGHGPVRYFIESYEPGHSIIFRFTGPKGFDGIHGFFIEEIEPGLVKLEHRIEMNVKGLEIFTWPILYRPLHDAVLEDALYNAEVYLNTTKKEKPEYSNWVSFLRWVFKRINEINKSN